MTDALDVEKKDVLFFCDFETTGTNVDYDVPISFAAIITDTRLNEIMRISVPYIQIANANLHVQTSINSLKNNIDFEWSDTARIGYNFHKIEVEELCKTGLTYKQTVDRIQQTLSNVLHIYPAKRIVVYSDNIVFEYLLLKKIYAATNTPWPFHYSGRDINILTEGLGIEESDLSHNCMEDVKMQISLMRQAMTKLGDLYVL